jgi:hypothetical protein
MSQSPSIIGPSCLAALVAASAAAAAGPAPRVVCSDIPGHPTSVVPGAPGYRFEGVSNENGAKESPFGRPQVGVSTSRWYLRSTVVDPAGHHGEVILVGAGETVRVLDSLPVAPAASAPLGASDPLASMVVRRAEGGLVRLHEALVGASSTAPASGGPNLLPAVGPESGAVPFLPAAWFVAPGGDWLVRGVDVSGSHWVFRNGAVAAAGGRPVTHNSEDGERFAVTGTAAEPMVFFSMQANRLGDVVIGGRTDAAGAGADSVVVFNRQRIVVRTGDGVDLDGDGVALEGVTIGAFDPDGAVLSDEGWFYFTASLRGTGGEPLGHALLRVRICRADWDGSGEADAADIGAFLTSWMTPAGPDGTPGDFDGDGVATGADVTAFLRAWSEAVAEGC